MQKVLIVTYYWPPSAGGGVQRWLRLATHLSSFGIEPVIFTPENPAFGLSDPSLLQTVPADLEVWKFPIWEPFNLLGKKSQPFQGQVLEKKRKGIIDKIMISLRANFFIPDPRYFWVRPSVRFLQNMIAKNNIDAVITTGPPHSMHLIGLGLKRKTGIKWIADFRDPWSQWDILDKLGVKGWARKQHLQLEKKVLKSADLLITVSPAWETNFRALGATKTFVLTNGFDDQTGEKAATTEGDKFVISHIGMLNEMRNPEALWRALASICKESPAFASVLEIYLAGIPSEMVVASIKSHPQLKDRLVVDGYLSHADARRAMQKADVLLLLMNDSHNARGHIPGKLFEYLSAQRPVLAIGDSSGDSAQILADTKAGTCVAYGDQEAMKAEILRLYQNKNEGIRFMPEGIDRFNRKNLAEQLAAKLKEL